ncbi:excinuclease ABC subunit C, partial [archaeon D22]
PDDPGCYIYKDSDGNILYIGKAKSLKKRVRSYFTGRNDTKTQQLVSEIRDVEYFVTSNEVEALILENNLIKKHKPKYNIDLKDSKRYAYIIVTEEKYPRLRVARDKSQKGKYYGPYVSAEQRDTIIKVLRASFQVRTCNKLPKRECLRYHINLCSAPCINNISETDYNSQIRKVETYLKGKVEVLAKELNSEMKTYSEKLLFEKAKIIRDQLFSLERLAEKQKFELDKKYDEDIINYIIEDDKVYLIVFNVSKGMLTTKNEYSFDYNSNFLEEFMTLYYSMNPVPKEIVLPRKLEDDSILSYLESLRKKKVKLNVPKLGDKLKLLNLVKRNIEISFLQESEMTNELREKLKLNSNPHVIECFDISHLGGTNIVASMVQFRGAKPDKSNYRKFKIRTVDQNDDFASMAEVVKRRYKRLKEENSDMPDLIVIDGGKGQLSASLSVLK